MASVKGFTAWLILFEIWFFFFIIIILKFLIFIFYFFLFFIFLTHELWVLTCSHEHTCGPLDCARSSCSSQPDTRRCVLLWGHSVLHAGYERGPITHRLSVLTLTLGFWTWLSERHLILNASARVSNTTTFLQDYFSRVLVFNELDETVWWSAIVYTSFSLPDYDSHIEKPICMLTPYTNLMWIEANN